MEQLMLGKGEHALAIVAHPDDETIWMGGTIARNRAAQWIIFVLCRKSDPDRMPKFMHAAEHYGAQGIICDLEDEGVMDVRESIMPIQAIIRKELSRQEWDVVFTHGANGEYGHPRHKGAHQAVKTMLKSKEIRAKRTFCFAYRLDEQKKIAVPAFDNAAAGKLRFYVQLSNKEWRTKRNAVKNLYGFRPNSFENRSCAKIETFIKLT